MLRRLGYACLFDGGCADAALPELMRRAARTWEAQRDGVPKIHYSTQADGLRPGAHADYVEPADFANFLALAPADVEFDCMLEAKAKDLALFRLRDALGIGA
jgi:UV DNA damage endonuclease